MQTIKGSIAWRKSLVSAARVAKAHGQDTEPMRARPAGTYRGARRNQDRTNARCRALKEERKLLEVSRRELDRMRHARWQLIKIAESKREFDAELERQANKYNEELKRAMAHMQEQIEIKVNDRMNEAVA